MTNAEGKPLKVAIVHDWLIGGGAERVVYELHKMFPDAPIYTSYCSDNWRQRLDGKVITGYLQHWPFSSLRKFLPVLRIWWFTHLDLSGYDLVISSSGNGEAKGIKVPIGTLHVCYCHTPTHFYWRHYEQYVRRPGFGILDPIARFGLRLLVGPLRKWDLRAAERPDYFIANSAHIQEDIKKYYDRDSIVIHPPINVDRFKAANHGQKRYGFITVGRLAAAKRVDIIVEACTQLGLPLKVVGSGPDYNRLKRLAGPSVEFFGKATGNWISDDAVPAVEADAEAFLFASFDDFGIAPVEALAAGTPVLAYRAGGALDYVVESKTGLFFDNQTTDSLSTVLRQFSETSFDHQAISQFADQFSETHFTSEMQQFINRVIREGRK